MHIECTSFLYKVKPNIGVLLHRGKVWKTYHCSRHGLPTACQSPCTMPLLPFFIALAHSARFFARTLVDLPLVQSAPFLLEQNDPRRFLRMLIFKIPLFHDSATITTTTRPSPPPPPPPPPPPRQEYTRSTAWWRWW